MLQPSSYAKFGWYTGNMSSKIFITGDTVIIAGKGHEDYQIIGEEVTHFSDKEAAGEILKELGYED